MSASSKTASIVVTFRAALPDNPYSNSTKRQPQFGGEAVGHPASIIPRKEIVKYDKSHLQFSVTFWFLFYWFRLFTM
jgi:hypothetical protein